MKINRNFLFKLVSVALPFVFLFLLEITLRAIDYGHDLKLFVEHSTKPGFLHLNPHASKRYFLKESTATYGNIEPFKKVKDSNTFRIFVLGESTTLGYPYPPNGSFHRWLAFRLSHTFPDKNFEIINLSLTAVNTYTVLGFSREVINYKPDAVLIYVGHNEYYGAMGVSSTSNLNHISFLKPTILKLKEYRIVQAFTNVFIGVFHKEQLDKRENLMKRMAADQSILFNSDQYHGGIRQFENNLKQTLSIFKEKNIPVFISNLVSNQKDLKPFISISRFPSSSLFFKHLNNGISSFQKGNITDSYKELAQAVTIDSSYALCHYYLGKIALMKQEYSKAQLHFFKAKEHDALRFRAPEELNLVIIKLTQESANIHFVDTRNAFQLSTPGGIIGNELMLEHVHPNLVGYALLSEAFYKVLKVAKLIDKEWKDSMSFDSLLKKMPITKVDSLKGAYEIMMLKENWPFNEKMPPPEKRKKTFEETLAGNLSIRQRSWEESMNLLYEFYVENRNYKEARRVAEALILENPYQPAAYDKAVKLSMILKDYETSLFYSKKLFVLHPSDKTAKNLFIVYLKQDRPEEAMNYINFAIKNNSSGTNLLPLRDVVEKVVIAKEAYSTDTTNLNIINNIAAAYNLIGNYEAASKYVHKALKIDKRDSVALSNFNNLKLSGMLP